MRQCSTKIFTGILPGGGVWPEDDSLDMLVNVEGRLAAGQYVFLQGHVNNVMPEAGGADSFTQWGVAAGGTHLIAGEDGQVNDEPVKNARQWLSAAWDVDYYDIDAATWFALRASLDITAVQKAMVVFGPRRTAWGPIPLLRRWAGRSLAVGRAVDSALTS